MFKNKYDFYIQQQETNKETEVDETEAADGEEDEDDELDKNEEDENVDDTEADDTEVDEEGIKLKIIIICRNPRIFEKFLKHIIFISFTGKGILNKN